MAQHKTISDTTTQRIWGVRAHIDGSMIPAGKSRGVRSDDESGGGGGLQKWGGMGG